MQKEDIQIIIDHMNDMEWAGNDETLIAEANKEREMKHQPLNSNFEDVNKSQDKYYSKDYWIIQLVYLLHANYDVKIQTEMLSLLNMSRKTLKTLREQYTQEFKTLSELLNTFNEHN